MPEYLLEPDRWLAERLGCPVHRLSIFDPDQAGPGPGGGDWPGGLVYARVPAAAVAWTGRLEDNGFRLVEVSVVLETSILGLKDVSGQAEIRWARPEDEAAVRRVAAKSFSWSRFHLDPRITREAADRIKSDWAGNFFGGQRGQAMTVTGSDDRVDGFLQLIFDDQALVVDLIAVSPEKRRQGLAASLIAWAARELEGFDRIRVGTQAANAPSIALYEGLGFRFKQAFHTLHRHGLKED